MNLQLLKSSSVGIMLILAGFLLAYQFVEPAPPKTIVMATGSPTGAYHKFGSALREALAAHGIELTLRNSAGSGENASLLAAGEVDVALLQGGTELNDIPDSEHFRGLASLYYEPLWIFHRIKPAPQRMRELAGRRVNRGAPGSGTRGLVDVLLALNKIPGAAFSEMDDAGASAALLAGELDAVFMVGGEDSPTIRTLLTNPSISLMDLPRAQAYHLHHRYLSPLLLPAGGIDLAAENPPSQRQMVGVTAMLVAREDFHPALVDLLLLSSRGIVGGAGLFSKAQTFPSGEFLSIPMDADAARFHERGPSFLQRFLPFWAATLIDRLIVMLVPLLALVLPLMKIFPPFYRWRVRSRIYRWYADLRNIEIRLDAGDGGVANAEKLTADIQRIEAEVKQVDTPLSYADELYHLRSHIDLVQARIDQKKNEQFD